MTRHVKFILEFPPRTKKNHGSVVRNRRTGKPIHLPSKAYMQYESEVVDACSRMGFIPRPKALKMVSGKMSDRIYERQLENVPPERRPMRGPLNIKAIYYVDSKRRVDLNGLNQALHDALVAAGVLLDDSAINPDVVIGTDGSRVKVDPHRPRTDVRITIRDNI